VKAFLSELIKVGWVTHVYRRLFLVRIHVQLLKQQGPRGWRPLILPYQIRFGFLEKVIELFVELFIPELRVKTLHFIAS
jgi:hypothetical protein